jgi:hypothetical protein
MGNTSSQRITMKLWILARIGRCGTDEADGFAVLAYTSRAARELAAEQSGDEKKEIWLDPARVTCESIAVEGPSRVLLRSFVAG